MPRTSREDINGKTLQHVTNVQNHVILPNHIVQEHNIKPHDTVGLIGWRAKNCAAIAFEVQVHQHNHSIHIPQWIMDWCGFGSGSIATFKLVRVRHNSHPRKKIKRL